MNSTCSYKDLLFSILSFFNVKDANGFRYLSKQNNILFTECKMYRKNSVSSFFSLFDFDKKHINWNIPIDISQCVRFMEDIPDLSPRLADIRLAQTRLVKENTIKDFSMKETIGSGYIARSCIVSMNKIDRSDDIYGFKQICDLTQFDISEMDIYRIVIRFINNVTDGKKYTTTYQKKDLCLLENKLLPAWKISTLSSVTSADQSDNLLEVFFMSIQSDVLMKKYYIDSLHKPRAVVLRTVRTYKMHFSTIVLLSKENKKIGYYHRLTDIY